MNKWLVVIVLALLVLTSAMGLKALTTHSTSLANNGSPVPPSPWLSANNGSPVPPSPWLPANNGSPVPPSPWK